MSVKAKNITINEDGLPVTKKSDSGVSLNEDGLPISKKKEDGGTTSKVSPSGVGAQPTTTPQPSTSASDIKPSGPKDWSSIENAIRDVSQKNDEYKKAKEFSFSTGDIGEGISIPNTKFAADYQKEAKANLDKSVQQKEQIIKTNQQQLYEPIKSMIDSGKYKDFFDSMGNFKAAEAISYFDNLTKANKAGSYTRDMMVSLLKQSGQYELDQPERKKLREEEYKKEGIDINKYGINLLDKLTAKQKSNIDLLEKETKAKAANLMDVLKPKATEFGQQYMQLVEEIKQQFQQKQISEEDANNRLKELNNKYHSQITQLDKEYQNGVRQININAQNKYSGINSEIQNVEKSVTDEMIWQSIPEADRKKIENVNNKVENEIQRQHNVLRQGLDILSDAGQAPMSGLFQKSLKSGWYSGLANIGSYLSSKGYNNSFTRYLQGKDYEAAVNAPAEYTYKQDFLKRSVTGTGTSLGASAPIMIPSIGLTLGAKGLGVPELVGTVATGLTSYYGEKAPNTGQVYQQIMDQTGDPSKAIEGAKRYEDKQLVMMPLYFIEAAGLQNLLKGGVKKYLIGTGQELAQELPTEYWQNYTQAQEAEGYKGSFGSYIKEHPETTLDVIASTLGQSGMVSMAGKVFNQISSLIPQAKAQYYADIIGKHGIDFAMENLQHQFNTGVIDEKQFQAEQDKIMLAAKKLKDFEGLGLKGDDAKAYFTLTESANRLKKAIGETDDEGLRIGYESQLKETQQQLDELVKGKGAYAIFTLPGGGEQTKIVPLAGIQKLDQSGHLNTLIHLSDKVEVKGDETLNKELQDRKQQLGNPSAPEGFYSQSKEDDIKNKIEEIERRRKEELSKVSESGEDEGNAMNRINQRIDINERYDAEISKLQANKGSIDESRSIIEGALKNGQIKGMQADVAKMVLEQAKDNPEAIHQFFKEVADQALNKVDPEAGDPSADAEKTYGKDIVEHAKELFPAKPTYESIQQNSTKAYETVAPILQRMNNADYINENELDAAANHLYDVLDQVDKSDMTDEQKKSSANLIEPLIQKIEGYDFRTKTETSTVTEAKTASIPTKTTREIRPALEQSTGSKATITAPDGSTATGTLNIRSGQYVLDVPQGQQRIIGEKAITDRDLTLPTEQEMENPIKFDKDGNVESVTVKDRNGNLIEIKDAEKALDIAIQLRADMIGEVPAQLFDNTYEEIQKEISEEKLIESPKTQTDAEKIREDQAIGAKTGQVSEGSQTDSGGNLQQAEGAGTKTSDTQQQIISSPKTQDDGKSKKAETKTQTEGLRQDVAPDTGIGKEGVAGSEPVAPSQKPPSPPSETTKTTVGTPKQEDTAIRKAKLEEIKAVKDMFEASADRKKWVGIIESALNNLQTMYPDKSLYDAAKDRVSRFALMFDNKIPFNPTTEDLAVFQYFKAETEKAINDIQGWDSQNDTERIFAIAQYRGLNEDLVSVAKAINPSEAGRAFGYRSSEMNLDPEYGLQIRRMDMMERKGGERLTDEEKEWTANQWEKEKELMKQEQELKEKRMTEEFDKRMADLRKEYEEKLKQSRKAPTKKEKADEKRDDYLKNKGKEWADKIRSNKLKGGTFVTVPGLPQLINLAIEGVARLVEAGYTIAEAIDKHVKDNNLKESEANSIRNHFNNFIDRQIKQEESLGKIKELAKSNNVTSITTDMVSKNLIKDFVESHIGEVEPENLLEHVTNKLEETLPNLSKEKLIEAYLKTGEFKIPTKQQLQSEYAQDKAKLQRIAKLEKDINDLKSKKDIYNRSGNKSQERQVDKDIASREKELKKALQDTGLKTSNEDKFSKASYETRAQSHNDRISALSNKIDDLIANGNLTKEQQSALTKLKGQLDASRIKLDPNSKLSQRAVVDNAENVLKKIYSDFDKSLGIRDMIPVSQIRKGLRQAIDKFNTEKEESEQNLKLQRTKDNLERGNAELQRKINAGEFNDEKVPIILKASDAELVKLQIQRNKLESETRKKQNELGEKNKSKIRKALELTRAVYVAALIYRFGTFAKVAATAIIRPNVEAATKLTFGQLFKATFPEFYNRAKAGGESSSLRAVKESYTALLRQVGDKKMLEIKDKAYNKYSKDREAYNAYEKVAAASPNDKAVQNRLQELKNNMNNSLLDATSIFVYDYIGSSSIKDSLDALLYRSNKIEKELGHLDVESIKDGNAIDKINYVIGFIGRSHAAMKTFSARASFASGFIARLENAMHNGVDISNSDEILKIGHESYLDWERGKYQQKNLVTDLWNEVTRRVENYAKGTAWEKYSKAIAEGLRFDVAITRVPVNILHEAVMEYTLGSFRAFYKIGQEYRTANKQIALHTDLNPDTKEFKEAVKAHISNMDANQAATIARCFRKGGFGLGLYAFAMISGLMAFGGFHHKGEKKKKEEDLEEGELNPGEIMIGHKKMGELMSKIIEHTPAAYPTLFGLNLAKVYGDNIEKGKTTPDAAMAAAIANLEAIQDAIPQAKVINPIGITQDVTKGALRQADKFWEWTDIDEQGNVVNRKPMDFKDQIKLLIGDRKNVLTEDNYKTATSVMKDFNSAISDLRKQNADKDQIEELKKQRDEQIKQIYELNKQGQ